MSLSIVFNPLFFTIKLFLRNVQLFFNNCMLFLPRYYTRNELVWLDGFLLDFLQKKTADIWLRKFVIYTGFIFSERLIFDFLIKIYLDNLLWPLHLSSILEVNNVIEMLAINIFFYFSIFILFFFIILTF